ncbi:hypothetical protein PENTCL1PPCAC_8729 [Pristionchus entomophagus]|uniref:Uncharacterized protein n=1 Tax=Pristionchus entomophagus TaxID=358040 RepID=A0AAV5SUJ0_9BILA|nr:hypothetical protein PENTCL1PPCAC_8729 [Pristionchus entomophagus]
MAAAIVPTLTVRWGRPFPLPRGIADGSILTFQMWHTGDLGAKQPVNIDFPPSTIFDVKTDRAHFRVDKGILNGAVASNTWVGGRYMADQNDNNRLDEAPPSVGWWKVDVYKHEEFHMSVFLQGFWLGVREFEVSLNRIRSVAVTSDFMDMKRVPPKLFGPNLLIVAPVSVDQFNKFIDGKMAKGTKLVSFPQIRSWRPPRDDYGAAHIDRREY